MFQEKRHGPRAGSIDVHDVAGEHQKIGPLAPDQFKDSFGGGVGGIDQQIGQMRRNLGQPCQGAFEMEITGVNETKGLRHRRLEDLPAGVS